MASTWALQCYYCLLAMLALGSQLPVQGAAVPPIAPVGTAAPLAAATAAVEPGAASASLDLGPTPTTAPSTESSESSAGPDTSTAPTAAADAQQSAQQSALTSSSAAAGVSSGIVALAMAVAFAVLVIVVYAGLLLWRRYLEYRYGNRELLVNDLQFDTNDLRHFEL